MIFSIENMKLCCIQTSTVHYICKIDVLKNCKDKIALKNGVKSYLLISNIDSKMETTIEPT